MCLSYANLKRSRFSGPTQHLRFTSLLYLTTALAVNPLHMPVAHLPAGLLHTLLHWARPSIGTMLLLVPLAVAVSLTASIHSTARLPAGLLHTLLYWARPSIGTMLLLVPLAVALALTASSFALGLAFASLLLNQAALRLPGGRAPQSAVAAPARSQLSGPSSQDARSGDKSSLSGIDDAPLLYVGEDDDEEEGEEVVVAQRGRRAGLVGNGWVGDEREGGELSSDGETADVAWQDEAEYEDLHGTDDDFYEPGEAWS